MYLSHKLGKLTFEISLPLLVKQKSGEKINLSLNLNFKNLNLPKLKKKSICLLKEQAVEFWVP